jgi:hypothetical protein
MIQYSYAADWIRLDNCTQGTYLHNPLKLHPVSYDDELKCNILRLDTSLGNLEENTPLLFYDLIQKSIVGEFIRTREGCTLRLRAPTTIQNGLHQEILSIISDHSVHVRGESQSALAVQAPYISLSDFQSKERVRIEARKVVMQGRVSAKSLMAISQEESTLSGFLKIENDLLLSGWWLNLGVIGAGGNVICEGDCYHTHQKSLILCGGQYQNKASRKMEAGKVIARQGAVWLGKELIYGPYFNFLGELGYVDVQDFCINEPQEYGVRISVQEGFHALFDHITGTGVHVREDKDLCPIIEQNHLCDVEAPLKKLWFEKYNENLILKHYQSRKLSEAILLKERGRNSSGPYWIMGWDLKSSHGSIRIEGNALDIQGRFHHGENPEAWTIIQGYSTVAVFSSYLGENVAIISPQKGLGVFPESLEETSEEEEDDRDYFEDEVLDRKEDTDPLSLSARTLILSGPEEKQNDSTCFIVKPLRCENLYIKDALLRVDADLTGRDSTRLIQKITIESNNCSIWGDFIKAHHFTALIHQGFSLRWAKAIEIELLMVKGGSDVDFSLLGTDSSLEEKSSSIQKLLVDSPNARIHVEGPISISAMQLIGKKTDIRKVKGTQADLKAEQQIIMKNMTHFKEITAKASNLIYRGASPIDQLSLQASEMLFVEGLKACRVGLVNSAIGTTTVIDSSISQGSILGGVLVASNIQSQVCGINVKEIWGSGDFSIWNTHIIALESVFFTSFKVEENAQIQAKQRAILLHASGKNIEVEAPDVQVESQNLDNLSVRGGQVEITGSAHTAFVESSSTHIQGQIEHLQTNSDTHLYNSIIGTLRIGAHLSTEGNNRIGSLQCESILSLFNRGKLVLGGIKIRASTIINEGFIRFTHPSYIEVLNFFHNNYLDGIEGQGALSLKLPTEESLGRIKVSREKDHPGSGVLKVMLEKVQSANSLLNMRHVSAEDFIHWVVQGDQIFSGEHVIDENVLIEVLGSVSFQRSHTFSKGKLDFLFYSANVDQSTIKGKRSVSLHANRGDIRATSSDLSAREGIKLASMGSCILYDTRVMAQAIEGYIHGLYQSHGSFISAKRKIEIVAHSVEDLPIWQIHFHEHTYTKKSGWGPFKKRKEVREVTQSLTVRTSYIGATHIRFYAQDGASFQGTHIDSPDALIALKKGTVQFKGAQNSHATSNSSSYNDLLWRRSKTSQRQHVTFTPCIGNVRVLGPVEVDKIPGQEGINVNTQDSLTYKLLYEIHDCKTKKFSGPTTAFMQLIGLTIAIATSGIGSSLGLSAATAAGQTATVATVNAAGMVTTSHLITTTGAFISGMTQAAFTNLCAQSAMALVNAKGDLGKAGKGLWNVQTSRSLLLSSITGGLTQGLSHHMRIDLGTVDKNFSDHLKAQALQAGVETGVNIAAGHNVRDPMEMCLRSIVAATIGAWGANQIGLAYNPNLSGGFNPVTHKLAHGLLGAAVGGMLGGKGCVVSGALGAMMAETFACLMLDDPIQAKEQELGRTLTYAEYESLFTRTFEAHKKNIEDIAKLAKIMNVMSAWALGLNVDVAHFSGSNAVDHNFVMLAGYAALLASMGYSAYCVHKSYIEHGPVAALQQFGIEIALNAAGVATGKFVLKAGGKLIQCDSVQAAIQLAFERNPSLKFAMGSLTRTIILAIEALDRTALGQAAARLEGKLVDAEKAILKRFRGTAGEGAAHETIKKNFPHKFKVIDTPYGMAHQSMQEAALLARAKVEDGAFLYRVGTIGRSQAAEAQFWALENPYAPGFAQRHGIPETNVLRSNFIEVAQLKPGTSFITRFAPAVGNHGGGSIEVVVPPNGVIMRVFSYLGNR